MIGGLAAFDGTSVQMNGVAVPVYYKIYGQQQVFLVPVPEASTVLAGAGALGLVLLGFGGRSKRSGVVHIGK